MGEVTRVENEQFSPETGFTIPQRRGQGEKNNCTARMRDFT